MLEAIALCERIAGRELDWTLSDQARDRRPPLVDPRPRPSSARDYPGVGADATASRTMLREIHDANVERWAA